MKKFSIFKFFLLFSFAVLHTSNLMAMKSMQNFPVVDYKKRDEIGMRKLAKESPEFLYFSSVDTRSETVKVIRAEDSLVGFVRYSVQKEDLFNDGNRKKWGWLKLVGVFPWFQKKGFGRELLLHAFKDMASRGVHGIYATVEENNQKVARIVDALGAETVDGYKILTASALKKITESKK